MSAIRSSIPLAGMKVLPLPPLQRRQPEEAAEMFKRWEEMRALHDPVESARRIAEQRAIKVHTVFKVDGKVVGIVHRNGWTTFSSNGAGAGIAGVHETAARLGRSGDALNDMLADHSAKGLRSLYGSRLQVERYPDATSAPTSGEVEDLMFGRASGGGRLNRFV